MAEPRTSHKNKFDMKKQVFYLVLFFAPIISKAQTGISGQVKADYVPFSNYVRPIDSVKTDSKSNFKRVQAALEIPLSLKMVDENKPKLWSLYLQGSYATMENKYYDEKLFPTKLLNAQIGVKHIRPIGGKWSMMATLSVGVYTDLDQITVDDVLLQGGVLFIKNFKPNLAFGFGPVLTNAFGVPMVLPGIYFNWETQTALHFKIAFPEGAEIGYRFTPNFDLKAVIELDGMTAEVSRDGKSKLLGYQQVIAGIRPQFKLGEHWTVDLTAGSTLTRSFQTNDRKISDIFKEKDMANPKFTTTFYGAAALKWKF
ncbi:hypothetical protein ABH942_003084 [Flavobacterium sp. 28YEA47A]